MRGLESGGAAGELGRYVTFSTEEGRPIERSHPVEAIGVNGLHAVIMAPVLVRVEMLRKGRTYELLITLHRSGHRQRWQAPSPGDEGLVSRNSWTAGVGPVGKRERPSRCCIAGVLLARRRRSNHPKTISRGGSRHHKGSELRWMFALSLFQSAQGRNSHWIVVVGELARKEWERHARKPKELRTGYPGVAVKAKRKVLLALLRQGLRNNRLAFPAQNGAVEWPEIQLVKTA